MNVSDENYSASKRECLAVMWAFQTVRPDFLYEKYIFNTDHAALHWMLKLSDPGGRLMRGRFRLAEIDFKVKHKNLQKNQPAEALSRLLKNCETLREDEDDEVFILQLIILDNHYEFLEDS